MSSQFWQDEEGWLVVFSYGREHTWTGTQPVSRPLDTLHTGWPCPQNIVRSLSHRGFHLDNWSSLSVIDAVHSVKYCKVAAGCMHHLADQVKCAELAQTCTESINIMLGQAGWVWKSLWISICLALTNGELRTYVAVTLLSCTSVTAYPKLWNGLTEVVQVTRRSTPHFSAALNLQSLLHTVHLYFTWLIKNWEAGSTHAFIRVRKWEAWPLTLSFASSYH